MGAKQHADAAMDNSTSRPGSSATTADTTQPSPQAGPAPSQPLADLTGKPELDHAMRDPLLSLMVLTPYFLWAEGLRFLDQDKITLLAEGNLALLGDQIGVHGSLLPWILLAIACPLAHALSGRPWAWPRLPIAAWVVVWGLIWAGVRVVTSYTSFAVLPPEGQLAQQLSDTSPYTSYAILMSGALQEEILFRGMILGGLVLLLPVLGLRHAAWQFIIALPLSATVFSLAHTDIISHHTSAVAPQWPLVMTHGMAGLIYGYAFLRHGLAVAVLAHCGANIARMWW